MVDPTCVRLSVQTTPAQNIKSMLEGTCIGTAVAVLHLVLRANFATVNKVMEFEAAGQLRC
jgi:hypothetical protein